MQQPCLPFRCNRHAFELSKAQIYIKKWKSQVVCPMCRESFKEQGLNIDRDLLGRVLDYKQAKRDLQRQKEQKEKHRQNRAARVSQMIREHIKQGKNTAEEIMQESQKSGGITILQTIVRSTIQLCLATRQLKEMNQMGKSINQQELEKYQKNGNRLIERIRELRTISSASNSR